MTFLHAYKENSRMSQDAQELLRQLRGLRSNASAIQHELRDRAGEPMIEEAEDVRQKLDQLELSLKLWLASRRR